MPDMQELANIAGMTASAIESGKLVWVVRCKDCKHNNPFGCMKLGIIVGDDWLCADGERRTDDA